MATYFDRARAFADAGAPPMAAALAFLSTWSESARAEEQQATDALKVLQVAKKGGYPLLPELEMLLELDRTLPEELRLRLHSSARRRGAGAERWSGLGLRSTSAAPPPAVGVSPVEERVVEAQTPWITTELPFAEAIRIADDPPQWVKATPQMTFLGGCSLKADGALWRYRMAKETDLTKPFKTRLKTRETIDITAEGRNGPGQSGDRRYSHVLHAAEHDVDLLPIVGDSGLIELSGDSTGCQIRVAKQVIVLWAADDPLTALMEAVLAGELWLWATGFCVAAGAKPPSPPTLKLPHETKAIHVAKAGEANVVVVGGGPAGLACAWLLSNPKIEDGKDAWTAPKGLKVKVNLVEKQWQPGGKAASIRRTDGKSFRIEEHGLHLAMGFYANLQRLLRLSDPQGPGLKNLDHLLIPRHAQGDPADGWDLTFTQWASPKAGEAFETWWGNNQRTPIALASLEWIRANQAPRPLLRAYLATWSVLRDASRSMGASMAGSGFLLLLLELLLQILCLLTLRKPTLASGDDQGELAAVASFLRWLARCARKVPELPKAYEFAFELIELATTVTIGLDSTGLFPMWAITDPGRLTGPEYVNWVYGLQKEDDVSIADWLDRYGVDAGFPERSRILDAVTAGLFTTPGGIAAGTFIHGFTRLLLNYTEAPFKYFEGGTGEAVIGPLYAALRGLPEGCVDIGLGWSATGMTFAGTRVENVAIERRIHVGDGDFELWGPATRPGWQSPSQHSGDETPPFAAHTLTADAVVLAIPPFAGKLAGIPPTLQSAFDAIGSEATVGLQNWTQGRPKFESTLISGIAPPLRCVATMEHLNEGAQWAPPIYACGEVTDAAAKEWAATPDPSPRLRDWLDQRAAAFQDGPPVDHYLRVNDVGTQRYVRADPQTQAARRYVFQTGVENLWLAGDWTRTALSCGSIEAAITSGLEAARHILETLGCDVAFQISAATFPSKGSP